MADLGLLDKGPVIVPTAYARSLPDRIAGRAPATAY
jgi:hypothetical protein